MHTANRGQPKGLYLLFFTELWERFGFYMVQTILVLYMSKGLLYSDKLTYLLYGAFSSMLYLTPVVGGYIADRYIGYRQAIILGAVLFMMGYGVMSIPHQTALFVGLSIVIVANGFFKPNVSSIVGDLYKENDPRRDGGFTYFYMGINIGSLIPPLFAGALIAAYTYSSGFLVAALGMIVSLITFLTGQKKLGHAGKVPEKSILHNGLSTKLGFYSLLLVGIFVAVGILHLLLFHPQEANLILILASIGIVGAVFFFIFKEPIEQRKKMFACLVLIALSVGFWAIYNQTFTSLMLFADRNMSKQFMGFTIDAEFTQFFNPFFIMLLSPFLSWLWVRLEKKGKNPSTPLKFSLGILCIAIGFFVLGMGVSFFNVEGDASAWWLALSYFIQTWGELLLSPIGLAMVTRLSPKHLVGMMMGVWFLTQAAAFAIGGTLATIADVPKDLTATASLPIYAHAFFLYGAIALVLAIFGFMLTPYLKRLIKGNDLPIPTPKG
jgi:POT family proton-dependent oligopeptide transporter